MGNLSAHDLVKQLRQSLSCERTALADFLCALAELDHRRLYVELGYGSAWDFCVRALGLSETATHYRLVAARQIQKQPELADEIRCGRLCITTVAKLSPVLTDENRAALVGEAAGKTTRQVEQMVARLRPKPVPSKDVVRRTDEPAAPQVQTQVLTETLLRKHLTVDGDQGRCQWPTAGGGICGSTRWVQFHHLVDRARGGPHTVQNIVLACSLHNQHAADLSWGRALMEKYRRRQDSIERQRMEDPRDAEPIC